MVFFGPRNVQGFIGGNPQGLGGRDHSVSFSRLFILSYSFFSWFDAFGLNVFLLSRLCIFYLKRTGWMTIPARLVLLHCNTSTYLFMEMHIWRLFVGQKLNKFSCAAFTLRGRCGWYWTQYFNNPLYSWGCAKYIGQLGFISELQLTSVQYWHILTAVECYCQTIIYCPTQKLSAFPLSQLPPHSVILFISFFFFF